MATKSEKTPPKKPRDIGGKVIEAAMELAATRGWRPLTLSDIAKAAALPLSSVYPDFPSKQAVLDAFAQRIDLAVLAEEEPEEDTAGMSARDRLFDVMMRRFDALQPYKAAVGNILYDQLRDPAAAAASLPQVARSMRWMLEAAGIDASGLAGMARLQGLIGLYLACLRVWLRDDSADMTKTMAALDGYLRRTEAWAERLSRAPRRAARETPGEAAEMRE